MIRLRFDGCCHLQAGPGTGQQDDSYLDMRRIIKAIPAGAQRLLRDSENVIVTGIRDNFALACLGLDARILTEDRLE
jgi:hypothetical protein